jgi:riboflavin synthase
VGETLMFTGLIEAVGSVAQLRSRGNYRVIRVAAEFKGGSIKIGESISCDGACLTVVEAAAGWFEAEASQETSRCTILSSYRVGSRINLERALQVGERLGGHFVTGHVDTTGRVDFLQAVGESMELAVSFDAAFGDLVVAKGSVAINGLSLTVNDVRTGWLCVNLIPHTVRATTIGRLAVGEQVNLEFDMLGKYLVNLLRTGTPRGITATRLKESGW